MLITIQGKKNKSDMTEIRKKEDEERGKVKKKTIKWNNQNIKWLNGDSWSAVIVGLLLNSVKDWFQAEKIIRHVESFAVKKIELR